MAAPSHAILHRRYGTWVMPLTKEVQVAYLLRRLGNKLALPSTSFLCLLEKHRWWYPRNPLRKGGGRRTLSVFSQVGSNLPLPRYVDVRLHFPMIHRNARCSVGGLRRKVRVVINNTLAIQYDHDQQDPFMHSCIHGQQLI